MYAVIATGGKQYRVSDGAVLRVEKLDAEEGASIEFDRVLLVGDGATISVGKPFLAGGKVQATVMSQGKGRKIEIVKFHRRKNYRRTKGHRQHFTQIKITGIVAG
ncbi:MAG TPA: 50S ribosomal protein L21 [Gammaproteobacteria bacterium]|nr:50S ribosomal protein L21 [Gammaproteobacteria bacterium]